MAEQLRMSWRNSNHQYPYPMDEKLKFLEEREKAIGRRVSIRFHEPDGSFRDLLGHLITPTRVQKKDGSEVEFDPGAIAFFRVVIEKL
jgi:hypothetical protein